MREREQAREGERERERENVVCTLIEEEKSVRTHVIRDIIITKLNKGHPHS